MSRISTLSANNQLVKYMQQGQLRLQEKQVQLATEKKTTDYIGIAKSSERLINIETTREILDNYIKTNALMDMRLDVTSTVIDGIDSALDNFRKDLLSFQSTSQTGSVEVRDVQESAFTTIQTIESLLNTDINGEFLFSGGRVSTQPVDLGLTNLAALQTKYDGANIVYPTFRDNNVRHKMTASTGNPTNPTGAGFTNVSFAAGAGGTITTANIETQVNTVTLYGSVRAGDIYSVNVNGSNVSYTVTGDEADLNTIRDNLFAAINADSSASTFVTAAAGTSGKLTLTSKTAGTAFTSTSSSTNLTATSQIDTVTLADVFAALQHS